MNKNKNKNRGWARKRGWRKEGKKEKASSKQANSDEMERREERKKRKRSRERERRCGRAVVDAMRNEEEEKEGEVALCVRVQEDGQKVKIRSGEGGTECSLFVCLCLMEEDWAQREGTVCFPTQASSHFVTSRHGPCRRRVGTAPQQPAS